MFLYNEFSWGCMLRTIQAVLNNKITLEQLIEEDRISNERYADYEVEQAQKANVKPQAEQPPPPKSGCYHFFGPSLKKLK